MLLEIEPITVLDDGAFRSVYLGDNLVRRGCYVGDMSILRDLGIHYSFRTVSPRTKEYPWPLTLTDLVAQEAKQREARILELRTELTQLEKQSELS